MDHLKKEKRKVPSGLIVQPVKKNKNAEWRVLFIYSYRLPYIHTYTHAHI